MIKFAEAADNAPIVSHRNIRRNRVNARITPIIIAVVVGEFCSVKIDPGQNIGDLCKNQRQSKERRSCVKGAIRKACLVYRGTIAVWEYINSRLVINKSAITSLQH